jgi:rhodanese-related sulfurtransferase
MQESPLEITVAEVRQLLDAGTELLLLDCRTPDEHATALIAGAVLVPMQEIAERVAELADWEAKPVVVYCHHGMRSLRVTRWLRERGYSLARSMQGGIEQWSIEIDGSVPRY